MSPLTQQDTFQRNLRLKPSFMLTGPQATLFYKSFTESVLRRSPICYYGSLNDKSKNGLANTVNTSSNIIGVQQNSLSVLYGRGLEPPRREKKIVVRDNYNFFFEF